VCIKFCIKASEDKRKREDCTINYITPPCTPPYIRHQSEIYLANGTLSVHLLKFHGRICLYGEGRCYECREKGHKKSACPKLVGGQSGAPPAAGPPRPPTAPPRLLIPLTGGRPPAPGAAQRTRNSNKPQAGGRVHCLKAEKGANEDPQAVISGTVHVNVVPTTVLFDARATHSFVNPITAARMACEFKDLDVQVYITTPVGSVYQVGRVARNCTIVIFGRLLLGNLILLEIRGYDVILGMDWLTHYQATIDCNQKSLP